MSNHDKVNKEAEEIAKAASLEEDDIEEITNQQAVQSALGFYLPSIMEMGKKNYEERKIKSPNVFRIKEDKNLEEELPAFSNLLTNKSKEENVCKLEIFNNLKENTLFLNQAVPYVKLYKTVRNSEGKYIHIELPFDVVAGQQTGEKETLIKKITNGGSGGSVGMVDFSWKTEGKNEGNNSIYTVNFKITMQDANELEKVRNQLGDQKVAIIDLLYYGFLDRGKDANMQYDQEYLQFKAEVGFNFPSSYDKYKDFFKTTLHLSVYKHNFSFSDTGKVELDIIAIGNIEADFSNKTKYNILEVEEVKKIKATIECLYEMSKMTVEEDVKNYLASIDKEKATKISDTMDKLRVAIEVDNSAERNTFMTVGIVVGVVAGVLLAIPSGGASLAATAAALGTSAGAIAGAGALGALGAVATDTIIEAVVEDKWDVKTFREGVKQTIIILKNELKKAKINALSNILTKLRDGNKINFLTLTKANFESIKVFSSLQGELNTKKLDILKKQLEELQNKQPSNDKIDGAEKIDFIKVEEESWTFANIMQHGFSGFYIKDYDTEAKSRKKDFRKLVEDKFGEDAEVIDYVYFGDFLQEVVNADSDLKNNINLFLPPFSFYDYKSTFNDTGTNNKIQSSLTLKTNGEIKNYNVINMHKKYGNVYFTPISIDTIVKWFEDHIKSTEEKAYSFNNFIKFCFSDLLKQNIGVKVASGSPSNSIRFNPFFFNADDKDLRTTFVDQEKNSPTDRISISNLSRFYKIRDNEIIQFTNLKKNIAFISMSEINLDFYQGEHDKDCENGILYLPLNNMSGFVKKINFARDDDARLETANITAASDNAPDKIIPQVYHANVEMFGNCFFEPGNLVFIEANYPGVGIRNATLNKIGLGGYFRIIEIQNKISVGGFSTTLRCMWEMNADGNKTVNLNSSSTGKIRILTGKEKIGNA